MEIFLQAVPALLLGSDGSFYIFRNGTDLSIPSYLLTASFQSTTGTFAALKASTTVTATNGFVSAATNTLSFSSVGFFTNTLGKNVFAYFSAGAGAVVTNEYNNVVVSITTPTVIQLHPNWKVSGTAMSATLVSE